MPAMMAAAPYEIRTGGDGKSKKQSMAELKLRRLTELNQRLREDLERRRIPVSEAALEYVAPESRGGGGHNTANAHAVSLHSQTRSQKTGWYHHDGARLVAQLHDNTQTF
jgi:uncharacterized glyoxalase superfamily metalloenzyme YdcJ